MVRDRLPKTTDSRLAQCKDWATAPLTVTSQPIRRLGAAQSTFP